MVIVRMCGASSRGCGRTFPPCACAGAFYIPPHLSLFFISNTKAFCLLCPPMGLCVERINLPPSGGGAGEFSPPLRGGGNSPPPGGGNDSQ